MGWGSSTRRGGGRKLRARPRNFVFLGFRREESGMSREFCRDVPDPWRCSKSLCKKTSQFRAPPCISKQFHESFEIWPMLLRMEPRDGPIRNFHEKYQKCTPTEILKKYPKREFSVFWGYSFGIFWGIWGVNSGSAEFRPGFFLLFFVEILGWGISGLSSRPGHSQQYWPLFWWYLPQFPVWFKMPFVQFPESPARHLDASRQKLSPQCLGTISNLQLPSPKFSPKMPPKLSLAQKRGHFFPLSKSPPR